MPKKVNGVRHTTEPSVSRTKDDLTGALSINAFSKTYAIGRTKAYAEIKAHRLHAVKIGTRTLIPRAEAERWLRTLPALTPRPD